VQLGGDAKASFFGTVSRYRSLGRCRGVVFRNGANASSLKRCIRLKGQRAVKAVAATGRGKPLRASTPEADSARNKAEAMESGIKRQEVEKT